MWVYRRPGLQLLSLMLLPWPLAKAFQTLMCLGISQDLLSADPDREGLGGPKAVQASQLPGNDHAGSPPG